MSYHNYKQAPDHKVKKWLEESLKLTAYQKSQLYDQEIIRFAPFKFYERRPRVKNVWIRLSIIVFPIVWMLLFLSLPLNFLITGNWGYDYDKIKWYDAWRNAIGF